MTRTDAIRDSIRADILAGALPLGTRLSLAQLSARYKCSHMPAREALRELNGEGLVVLEPNQGAHVRGVDADFLETLFEVRSAVEALVARRAAERINGEELALLGAAQSALERHAAAGDVAAVMAANRRFHAVIHEAARSTYAADLAKLHSPLLGALWARFGYGEDRFPGVISDHRHLMQLLAERDGQTAALVAAAHAAKAKGALLRAMRQHEAGLE